MSPCHGCWDLVHCLIWNLCSLVYGLVWEGWPGSFGLITEVQYFGEAEIIGGLFCGRTRRDPREGMVGRLGEVDGWQRKLSKRVVIV